LSSPFRDFGIVNSFLAAYPVWVVQADKRIHVQSTLIVMAAPAQRLFGFFYCGKKISSRTWLTDQQSHPMGYHWSRRARCRCPKLARLSPTP